MFNNEVTAASRYSGGAPGLDAIVCPGIDQCGNVAEGEQGAFLCSEVLTEGLLCKARPKSPVCILRDLGSGSLWLHLIHLPGVLSARPPSLLTP